MDADKIKLTPELLAIHNQLAAGTYAGASVSELTPSDFCIKPWNCIFQKSEYETIARNCMVIQRIAGNAWGKLTEEEYVAARLNTSSSKEAEIRRELPIFQKVVEYTTSPEQAAKFSGTWADIVNKPY